MEREIIMLKVTKINSLIKEDIEIDRYIPIKVKWHESSKSSKEIICWRTGDLKKSMLEVGVLADSGEIYSLTIVSVDKITISSEEHQENSEVESGTPVFDMINWVGKRTINDVGLFVVQYCDERLVMTISRNHISKEIMSGRVSFGTDVNMNVCRISINNLSDDEKLQVIDTLEYMTKTQACNWAAST